MLIKTQEFDNKFMNDLRWITINKNNPLRLKGSYKLKEWGEPLSDIDVQANVYFNAKLIDIIYIIITRPQSPFTFIQFGVGRYNGFQLPWTIDDYGGCEYNPENVKIWYQKFSTQNLVPEDVLSYIYEKLFSDRMMIRNLLDVENAILPYSEIKWSVNDIRRGFIIKDSVKYYLLDAMKTETPVLEFVYKYNNQFIAIDFGLVDKNYVKHFQDNMYKYYTQNWYKILKGFRWKVYPEIQRELLKDVGNVAKLLSINSELDLLNRVQQIPYYSDLSELITNVRNDLFSIGIDMNDLDFDQIESKLNSDINNLLENYVWDYMSVLQPQYKKDIMRQFARGAESQDIIDQNILRDRYESGVHCPFFPTDINDHNILYNLSIRMNIPTLECIECFSKVAIERKIKIEKVMNIIGNNDLSILLFTDHIVLRDGTITVGNYPLSDLNKLRTIVLLYNK